MRVLITGATGFIGNEIINHFHKENYEISVLTRDKKKIKKEYLKVYENIDDISNHTNFDLIINLAGAPINKRWTESYKKELIESRIHVTNSIYDLVKRLNTRPKMLISGSAVGYYGRQGDSIVDEDSIPVNEFTHKLCKLWEQEALRLKELEVNVVILRLGIVLGVHGGILKKIAPVFKMGLGGTIGKGNQYFSWVHIFDVVQAIKFLLSKNNLSGVYNLTAPFPVTNKSWTRALSKALNRPAFFPMPCGMVRVLFGEMGDALLLHGQKVIPKKFLNAGFVFKYQKIESALSDIFSQ